jgi:hypothetical protein
MDGLKFLMIGLMNLIMVGINVYININKILFTVVYVPLLVFSIIKMVSFIVIFFMF